MPFKSKAQMRKFFTLEETIAVAGAIYWSWWRARDMHGEAP